MTKLKALVVDDEALACDMLGYLVNRFVPAIGDLKKCTSAAGGIEMLKSFEPDILFLDVQMPFMNGFELLETLNKKNFSVIFTTAYNKYAIKAIRFSALDYLLKPIDPEELKQAVDRHLLYTELYKPALYKNFSNNMSAKEAASFNLALRNKNNIQLVSPKEIVRCEGLNNYTKFFMENGEVLLAAKTIKEYEEILEEHGFVRTHKTHLVNIVFVKALMNDYQLQLTNGTMIEISKRRREEVMDFLKKRFSGTGNY